MDRMRAFAKRSFGYFSALFLLLWIEFAGLYGYFAAACSQSDDAAVWALLGVIALPVVYPLSSLWVVFVLMAPAMYNVAASAQRFVRVCGIAATVVIAAGGISWWVSHATGVHSSCSIGF